MFDLIDEYTNELFNSDDFKRLLELKGKIDKAYASLIVSFKTAEAKYEEMKQYGSYAPGLDKLKKDFIEAKARLYSKPEVVEYFNLERKIQAGLNKDLDEIKASVSNKFKASGSFFACGGKK